MLWWDLASTEGDLVLFWRTRIAAGVSVLGWFEILNLAFIIWVGLDFFAAVRDRRRCGLGQKVGYIGALVVLGALLVAYSRLDYALGYLERQTKIDDHAHPTLIMRLAATVARSPSERICREVDG